MTVTLELGAKNWGCSHKQDARLETIIKPYNAIFGNNCVPPKKQYWTLCGEMASNNSILKGCELDHMVRIGFITPEQFHGVEDNKDIYLANVKALSNSYDKVNLYNGEFIKILDRALKKKTLNPGVVYLDTIQEPEGSSEFLATVLDILNQTVGSTMLVWNFIQRNNYRNRHYSWDDVKSILNRNSLFRLSVRRWEQFGGDKVFWYGGTGKSSTTMGTVVFFRRDN